MRKLNIYYDKKDVKLYYGDSMELINSLKKDNKKFNLIFNDPPYFLSNDGFTCVGGEYASVNKGDWDKSSGFIEDCKFYNNYIVGCKEILSDKGILVFTGTFHNIFKIGYLLELNNFRIINDVIWYKSNAPPNLSCNFFVHSHETVLISTLGKHKFNYEDIKNYRYKLYDMLNSSGTQMRDVWHIPVTRKIEKKFGDYPAQKPLDLLDRIITAFTVPQDVVLDLFNGSGTTGLSSIMLNRKYIGCDKNEDALKISVDRFDNYFNTSKINNLYGVD